MPTEKEACNYRKGLMSLIILALLKKEDMYGYQLVQQTSLASKGKLSAKEGTLYPILYRLAAQGYVSGKRVRTGNRMTRVYYHLEPAGEEKLEELIAFYKEMSQGIANILGSSNE